VLGGDQRPILRFVPTTTSGERSDAHAHRLQTQDRPAVPTKHEVRLAAPGDLRWRG